MDLFNGEFEKGSTIKTLLNEVEILDGKFEDYKNKINGLKQELGIPIKKAKKNINAEEGSHNTSTQQLTREGNPAQIPLHN